MESPTEKLELITKYFADFTPHQLQQFATLEEAYKDWNAKINVVSRKDIDQLIYTMYYIAFPLQRLRNGKKERR